MPDVSSIFVCGDADQSQSDSADRAEMPALVPGRECGECTVCCKILTIDSDGLEKQSNTLCVNCTGTGCGIYDSRPSACRGYYCMWRTMPNLDDSWRPDKSGILVETQEQDIPPQYQMRQGILLTLVGLPKAVLNRAAQQLIADLVAAQVPTFLQMPGPAGHNPVKVLLNDAIGALEARNPSLVRDVLIQALECLSTHDEWHADRITLRQRERKGEGSRIGPHLEVD